MKDSEKNIVELMLMRALALMRFKKMESQNIRDKCRCNVRGMKNLSNHELKMVLNGAL